MSVPTPSSSILSSLRGGVVIPAHPLALNANRRLDERRQRGLTRYYLAAGAGGVAVGVHTTQFAIREPSIGLLRPVLELASDEAQRHITQTGRTVIRVAGVCGSTAQAVSEATLARDLGYDIGLLSLAALKHETVDQLIAHCREVAAIMPIMGFYLQPAVGGRVFPAEFWRRFAEIENVVAIKMAPFNRYHTLDVVRGVAEAGRAGQVTLYTGNDDNIAVDLLTPYTVQVNGRPVTQRIVGGLLGHWAVWTRRAVEQLEAIHALIGTDDTGPNVSCPTRQSTGPGMARLAQSTLADWLTRNIEITDANAAFFDVANGFAGCIAGLHEVLRRQGLLEGIWCLDPHESLSPGQAAEIDRVYNSYPHLNDDAFVREHLDEFLK